MKIISKEREQYKIKAHDGINNNAHLGINDALNEIRNKLETKVDWIGYDEYLRENNKRMSPAERAKKVKEFKKLRSAYSNHLAITHKLLDEIASIDTVRKVLSSIIDLKKNLKIDSKEFLDLINEADKLDSALLSIRRKLSNQAIKSFENLRKATDSLLNYNGRMPVRCRLDQDDVNFIKAVLEDASNISGIPKIPNELLTEVPLEPDSIIKKPLNEAIEDTIKTKEKNYESEQESSKKKIEELESIFTLIEIELGGLKDKEIKKGVETEKKAIRRVVKPNTLSITSQNLEKLKKSEELSASVTLVQAVLKNLSIPLLMKNGSRLNRKLDKLKEKISRTIETEKTRQEVLGNKQTALNDAVEFSTDAADSYLTTVVDKKRQENIDSTTSIKNYEPGQAKVDLGMELHGLESRHGQEYVAYTEVKGGDVYDRKQKYDFSKEMSEIEKRIDSKQQIIDRNNENRDKIKEKKITINEEYRDMKKKLEERSKLKMASLTGRKYRKFKGELAL